MSSKYSITGGTRCGKSVYFLGYKARFDQSALPKSASRKDVAFRSARNCEDGKQV